MAINQENPDAEGTEETEETEGTEEFDKDRAMKTIRTQRESEAKAKAELAEALERLSKYEAAEAEEEEKNKGLETKLAERDARIKELETKILESAVRSDFMERATARGYEDPALAFLAAKEQGVLGEVNPETGVVGDHDFETLEERFPSLAIEAEENQGGFGSVTDAGVRGGKIGKKPDQVFNDLIRAAIR